MKYTESNPPLQCMMTNSTCYQRTRKMKIKGILWHSTGANNPNLRRYVQPSDNDPNRSELLGILGVNNNRNDWNHQFRNAGVNAWIGKTASGEVTTAQALPWDYRPWGCGGGKYGSCNDGWIQFEICEDGLSDTKYFDEVYREACELTAYLCKVYGIDPHGAVLHKGVSVPTVLCHKDSHELGLGSGHSDITHWFPRFGKSMETVRNDVAAILRAQSNTATESSGHEVPTSKQEDDDMDVNRFKELYAEMRKELQDNDAGTWSQAARDWAMSNGLVVGNGTTVSDEPNCMWGDVLTREQLVTVLYRWAQMMGKA